MKVWCYKSFFIWECDSAKLILKDFINWIIELYLNPYDNVALIHRLFSSVFYRLLYHKKGGVALMYFNCWSVSNGAFTIHILNTFLFDFILKFGNTTFSSPWKCPNWPLVLNNFTFTRVMVFKMTTQSQCKNQNMFL